MPWMLPAAILASSAIGAFSGGGGGGNTTPSSNLPGAMYYQPTWQGGADTALQNYFQTQQNPYDQYAPMFADYLSSMQNNPYAPGYQNAGVNAGTFAGGVGQWDVGMGQNLGNSSTAGLMGFDQTLGQVNAGNAGFGSYLSGVTGAGNAMYSGGMAGQGAINNLIGAASGGNPAFGSYLQGANTAGSAYGSVGQNAITGAAGLPGTAASYTQPLQSYAGNVAGSLPGMAAGYAAPGNSAAMGVLNSSMDPMGSLYTSEYMKNLDSTRAGLAARGLNSSGVGAGIENQSNMDFNNQWQQQQLQRQIQGLSAYNQTSGQNYGLQSGALGQGLGALNTSANTGFGLQSGALTTAQELGSAGAGNIYTGAGLPYQTYQTNMSDQIGNLGSLASSSGAFGQTAAAGAQMPYGAYNTNTNDTISQLAGLSRTGSTFGQMSGQGSALLGQSVQDILNSGQLPYSAYTGMQGDQYGALSNVYGAAGTGYGYGNTMAGNLMQYMGMGPNAAQGYSSAAYQGAQNRNSQLGNFGSGIASLSNMFGQNGPFANIWGGGGGKTSADPYTQIWA